MRGAPSHNSSPSSERLASRLSWMCAPTPSGRVADYCEERLRRTVLDADMNYLHLSSLGSPPALRQQLERTGNYPMFFVAYHAYLAEYAQAKATLAQLAELARERRLCLLCRERDPHRCHRSVLAEQLSALVGQPVEHL